MAGSLGGGIYCGDGQAIIRNNRITDNLDRGIVCSGEFSLPIIENNTITDSWETGLLSRSSSSPSIRNNVIAWNWGDGIKCESAAAPEIVNCTIADNDLSGITSSSASPTIVNCILWNNGDDLSGCSASYSLVGDGDAGGGNIPFAPHFVNRLIDDYHLRSWSPAINAGDPNFVPDPNETDIDGDDTLCCWAWWTWGPTSRS